MIYRIGRLTRAELLKLFNQPFFFIALSLLAAATILSAWMRLSFLGAKASIWSNPHALQIFSSGASFGLKMLSFILVIFGSMLFAGEFDRGTIKILLTRPITRTDLFVAKCLTGLILAVILFTVVMMVSFGFGCMTGDLGPVWDANEYGSNKSYDDIVSIAIKAVTMSIPGIIAAVFLGIAISTLTDTSGSAVGIALTLFAGFEGTVLFHDFPRFYFNYYPGYAFQVLQSFASGTSAIWDEAIDKRGLYWTIPGSTIGLSTILAYVMFRFRNILV